MGHLKLECILAELSKYDGLKQEDIKSLPIMSYVSKQTRTSTSERTTNHLHTLWNELADCLAQITDAFQTGVTRERVMAIHRTCNDAGLAAFLKTQVEAKIQQLVNRNALLSAYYLEMAKGIHIRRLTRSSLSEKLQKFNGYLPSLDDWPADDHESSGNRPRLNTATLMPKWLQSHITTLLEQYDRDHLLDDVQFQQQYVDIIPSNWTVCSLTLDPTHNDLYAVQMRAGESPFILKLPLNRVVKRCKGEQSECVEYQEVDTEMKNIVQESDETIQYSSQCKTPEAVREWWTKRHSLDTRLKNLLYRVEGWFGGFKGILCGQRMESNNQIKKFQEGLNKLIHKVVMKSANKKAKIEFSLQLCRIILQLGESPSNRELEDVACFTLSCYDDCLIDIDSNRTNVDEVTKGLHSLITAYHENSKRNGIDTSSNKRNDHVILILDKYMQILPMESLPILRKQATSRLPCLSFLRDRILYAKSKKMGDVSIASDESNAGNNLSVSGQSVYYVLNPSGDLLDTQKQFEKLFKSNQNWNGIAGAAPMELQCKDALLSKDIYMYFGHSAGQSFLRGTTVRSLPKCAVSILMGCSSGKMESNGEYDPHGYILNYLIAGSPAVLGNLWDVTDRSIDNITRHMLQAWGAIGKNQGRNQEKSLVQALTESRDQCNLQYLIGAAPVVYGVPIYLE
ncbi:hypothetical protein RMCBS344292_01448 [Rhizopus microsporus]|nr:hypothetical protein RMCBS344292_01448 [Rhizopus microsporus]